VKNYGFKPSLRQPAIYRGWAPPAGGRSLNRRLGFEPKGDKPRHFSFEWDTRLPFGTEPGRPSRA